MKTKTAWFAVIRNPAQGESSDYVTEVSYSETPMEGYSGYTMSDCGHFYHWSGGRVMLGTPVQLTIEYEESPEKELEVLDEQEEQLRHGLEVALDALKARRLELALLAHIPEPEEAMFKGHPLFIPDPDEFEGSEQD